MSDQEHQSPPMLALIGDEPVLAMDDDRLVLRNFAETIAAVSLGTEGPFTIGVFARWGHGKTSLLRLSRCIVDEGRRPNVATVWFNAWQYEAEPHPIVPLVATIIRGIEESQVRGTAEKLKDVASRLIRALRAVAYGFSARTTIKVPGIAEVEAGFVAKEMIDRDEQLKGQSVDPLLDQSLYYNAFQLLAKLKMEDLKPEERPKIVVFVDDLDRCFPKKAVHLLESIKLVLAQPGFVFVLAVDKRVIEGYLTRRHRDDFGVPDYQYGQSYLDKIIQLPFDIPSHADRFEAYIGRMLERPELAGLSDDFQPMQRIIGPACNFNPREAVRFFNGILVDRFIWTRVNQGSPFDAGAFTVARSLKNQCGEVYRLMLRSPEFCDQLKGAPVADHLFDLRSRPSRPQPAGKPSTAEARNAGPEETLREGATSEPRFRWWTSAHENAVDELLGREHLCELLDSDPGQRWLGDKELRRNIEEFIAVQRAEPEPPAEEGDDVPNTIRRAIEKAEQVGANDPRFADPNTPELWVAIPAGRFWMGAQPQSGRNHDPLAGADEGPVHEVTLPAYQIGRYPVTVLEYARFVNDGGFNNNEFWTAGGFDQRKTPDDWNEQLRYPTRPVVGVSWYDACAYASWRGCRLPSEAEWERAARGPDGRRYPWGNEEPNPNLANYGGIIGSPTPVGVYPRGATPEQVYDLAGNVWEWCQDVYHKSYGGAPSDGTAWSDDESSARVLRGGSWDGDPGNLRSAYRNRYGPDVRSGNIGFRVASGTP